MRDCPNVRQDQALSRSGLMRRSLALQAGDTEPEPDARARVAIRAEP